jgi:hypothetical protein
MAWLVADFEWQDYLGALKTRRGHSVAYLQALKDYRDLNYLDCPWVFHKKGKPFYFGIRYWQGKATVN